MDAHEGLESAQEYNEMVVTLTEHVHDLAEINEALETVEKFGKVSAVLGIAGVGLDVVLSLSGGPSPEEKILEAVNELSSKVTGLWERVEKRSEGQQGLDDSEHCQKRGRRRNDQNEDPSHIAG